MADPLSVATGVAGLSSLSITVTESLVGFYTVYKDRDHAVAQTIDNLERLKSILKLLQSTLWGRKFQKDEQELVQQVELNILQCEEPMKELQEEAAKLETTSETSIRGRIKAVGRHITYPLRQSTLQKLEEDIGDVRENLLLALNILQLKQDLYAQDGIQNIQSMLENLRTDQANSSIREWLKAPDATVDYNSAYEKRLSGTGIWLTKSKALIDWMDGENSTLWLQGFAGSGKTVLCATAIEHTLRVQQRQCGLAFFFFSFNDQSKQDQLPMLKALTLQLSSQLQDGHKHLSQLQRSYSGSPPPSGALLEYFSSLIKQFYHVHIFIDALDECPRHQSRAGVLETIQSMREWSLPGLHIFVTSRNEPDIRESLLKSPKDEIVMKNAGIDSDIIDFIERNLDTDPQLRKWATHHDTIRQTLIRRAQGVFRWVECQFHALRRCPRSESHLSKCLKSLPHTLEGTYERMLCGIDEGLYDDAHRILTLLCFSTRPMSVAELIDAIAVDLEEPGGLNLKARLHNEDDLSMICPGLLTFGWLQGHLGLVRTVHVAHFSVKEYLHSDRILHRRANKFGLEITSSHAELARICLKYLTDKYLASSPLSESTLQDYPFAVYAATFWYHHYQRSAGQEASLDAHILRLFTDENHAFHNWVRLYDCQEGRTSNVNLSTLAENVASPVYYASFLGFGQVLLNSITLETSGQSHDTRDSASIAHEKDEPNPKTIAAVNTSGGRYGNPLQAASMRGHDLVVETLLQHGANVNTYAGFYGTALQAASIRGHDEVVRLLLDNDAEVNTPLKSYSGTLQAAAYQGNVNAVKMLIGKGAARVNNQGGDYGNALQAAARGGHRKLVEVLLDNGADLNCKGGVYGTALFAAIVGGSTEVLELLLDRGADVGAPPGYIYDNVFQAAEGQVEIMRILGKRVPDLAT